MGDEQGTRGVYSGSEKPRYHWIEENRLDANECEEADHKRGQVKDFSQLEGQRRPERSEHAHG